MPRYLNAMRSNSFVPDSSYDPLSLNTGRGKTPKKVRSGSREMSRTLRTNRRIVFGYWRRRAIHFVSYYDPNETERT